MNGTKWEQIEMIRKDIRAMKAEKGVQKIIVLWTANTERFSAVLPGLNDTADNLILAIKADAAEVSPSTLFAVASILEGVSDIIYIVCV